MMRSAKIVGLTGGISSGKSVAGKWLSQKLPVYDADEMVHELYVGDEKLRAEVREAFGGRSLTPDGVDRDFLRREVFSCEKRLQQLNRIIRPHIRRYIRETIDRSRQNNESSVFMIPLLFEAGWQSRLDSVLLISCPKEQQIERCLQRGFDSAQQVERIISSQMPLSEKSALADDHIVNDSSLEEFYSKLEGWYNSVFES